MSVSRIYVEKKAEFAVEARAVLSDLQTALRLNVTTSGSSTAMTQII